MATWLKLVRDDKVIKAPGKYVNIKIGDNLVFMSSLDHVYKIVQNHHPIMDERRRETQLRDFSDGNVNEITNTTYV